MKNHRRSDFAATMAVALLLIGRGTLAADAQLAATEQAPDLPTSDATKMKQLQERVEQRDVIIRDLLQRVESLERERPGGTAAGRGAAIAAASRAEEAIPPPQVSSSSEPSAQGPTPATPQTPSEPAQPGPGEFAVSEEAAQRALERALVQTGAALLPLGKFEFVPSLTYQFQRFSVPGQLALTTAGTILITENVTRYTQLEGNALIRIGLPWDAQAEIGLPWDFKQVAVASRVNGSGLSERSVNVQGLGDLTFSLTKQILAASDVSPGLFLSGTWNSNFGQVKDNVPLGTGFNELSAGLLAVKRQDPLVFTAGFTYQNTLTNNGFKPGDQYISSVGMMFAVSPLTSLRFSQQISFGSRDELNSNPIPGSEKTVGMFTFGLLSILGRGLVVNLTGGIGETHDAPNVIVQLAVPIRLN
jgi:hypothetical protein